jgi:plastocyanin
MPDWTITADVAKPHPQDPSSRYIEYNCVHPTNGHTYHARSWHVKKGQTVQWTANIPGNHHLVVAFKGRSPFKQLTYHGSKGQKVGGHPVLANADGVYEYCVSVFDERDPNNPVVYEDDPKIVVGG